MYEVITAHHDLKRVNQHIVEARVIEQHDDQKLTRLLRIERCILSFCFDLIFVERVEQQPYRITSTVMPQQSTFKDGVTVWALEAVDDQHTRLSLQAQQTPDFWIPPVIGPVILKRVLFHELDATCERIEALASPSATLP